MGQVTIFVIVAVIIVAVVGGYFVLRSDGIGGDVDLPSTPEGVEFKVYMDECLEDAGLMSMSCFVKGAFRLDKPDFLEQANKSTYANKDAPKASSSRLKSEDYHFEKDGLIYHDTYFGSRDFMGEEVVYKNTEPVWGLN